MGPRNCGCIRVSYIIDLLNNQFFVGLNKKLVFGNLLNGAYCSQM